MSHMGTMACAIQMQPDPMGSRKIRNNGHRAQKHPRIVVHVVRRWSWTGK